VLVVAVLLIGAMVSTAVFDVQRRSEDRYAGQIMDRYAVEVTEVIEDRVNRYEDALIDLAAALGAQPDLRGEQYDQITAGLDAARLPGASGVGFVVAATGDQIGSVQAHWRTRGASDLILRPTTGHDQHLFVVFDRPLDSGPSMRGTDLALSAQAAEAMNVARETGDLVVSPVFHLIRDHDVAAGQRQNSVVLAVPVHDGLGVTGPDTFEGWVLMAVRGQDFVSQTLIDRGHGAVQVSLTDTATQKVIAAARPGTRVADDRLDRERALTVGHRRWQVSMWPTTRLLATTDRGMSRLAAAAGIALTIMLAVVTGVLAGSRGRALNQVEQATAALRQDIERRETVEAQLRDRERQLQHLAFHDPLTGLANRQLFYERLSHAVGTRGDQAVGVLFIDLDGFKEINDARGHQAGDTVLRVVAERLQAGVRGIDTAARFGGDEFAVLLESLADAAAARSAAERIIADVQQPIDITGIPVTVSVSIGIAVHEPGETGSADDVLRDADAAMYAAKATGKNRYVSAEPRAV
jgi:diguanylate cyclase (GGDEF)-like protein